MAHTPSEPHPEDSRKPDSPTELTKPSWKYVLRSTIREVGDDGLTDLAAGLTYYTVLSIFPGLIALVSILSLFGQSADAVTGILDQVATVVPASTMDTIRPVLEGLLTAPAPGLGLIIGILTALWSASNYVKAFGRAMNVVYEVPEGRGPVKLNLGMYGLTAAILVLLALSLVLLAASGPILQAVGDLMGLGEVFLTVFSIVKWPILLVVAIVIVALLYYFTPNVRQPKMRWISPGAIIAIVLGGLAGVAFALYAGNFGSYNRTYGTLAGVIIFLFLIWILNLALLFGAEFDAEMERARQLQGGVAAEEDIQLPPRDTKASDKKEQKLRKDVAEGRRIRIEAARHQQGARQAPIDHYPNRG
ncbi:YihY/virulence factor BrkB family protein [Nigerium sp.]|uniref:YihY/virulence factor BrkB family protein n=1 Tax=Nigerium sp. TaxID=2042655 RepID=UPI00322140CA